MGMHSSWYHSPHPAAQDIYQPPSLLCSALTGAKYFNFVRFVPLLCCVYSLAWEGFHVFFLQTFESK